MAGLLFFVAFFNVFTNVYGDRYQIVFISQRPASDFGMKAFGKVIFVAGRPKTIVDIDGRSIALLDDLGKIYRQRTLLENERFVLSKNANFIGIESLGEYDSFHFTLENRRREILWQDVIISSHVVISDKGNAVVVTGNSAILPARSLDFYNNIGALVRHLDTDVINSVEISPRGDKVYFATPNSICSYDIQGNKLWEHSTKSRRILLSDNGEFIFNVQMAAENEGSSIEIYNDHGVSLGTLQFPNRCALLGISSDSEFVTVEEKNKLHLFEVKTQKLKWTYDLKKDPIPGFGGMGLSAVDVGADAKLTAIIVTGGQKVGPGPNDYEFTRYIRILDSEGYKICERFLAKTGGHVQIKLSSRGRRVTVWTKDDIYSFKIEREL